MEKKNLNHIVKEKIKEVEHKIIPGVQWNKENSWNKIKDILNTKNKQLIMWYFATAALVSVLVAATLDETIPVLEQFLPKVEVNEVAGNHISEEHVVRHELQEVTRPDLSVEQLQSKDLNESGTENPARTCNFSNISLPDEYPVMVPKNQKSTANNPVKVNVHASSNQLSGLNPGVSFQYQYVLKQSDRKTHYISIGTYTNLIIGASSEAGNNRFYPATFINAAYGQQKHQDRRSEWEIGAGYLLNPNQVIYKDTTIRFHYTRTVLGRLKVGPELILTNNLTKVFPGFTLAFG